MYLIDALRLGRSEIKKLSILNFIFYLYKRRPTRPWTQGESDRTYLSCCGKSRHLTRRYPHFRDRSEYA